MHECLICNVCENPGLFEHALEVKYINSNVRRFGDKKFEVWRCSNCSSLHCRDAVDLDPYYVNYPLQNQSLDFPTLCNFYNRLRQLRKHGLSQKHSILDYGCGTGLFVAFLKKRGFDAMGYDPYIPDFANRSVLNQKFDFVVSYDVVEHVAEPNELLQEYAELLQPGGMLFIGTPNASEIEFDETYSLELHQPYHRHILSEQALISLCRRLGLQCIHMYHRFIVDTPIPMINTQFIKRYISKTGGYLDAGFEEYNIKLVLTSPELLFFGFLGYFFRGRGNMIGVFQLNQ